MNAKTAKILRKVAKVSQRTDTYIKKQFTSLSPEQQRAYLQFVKLSLPRLVAMQKEQASKSIVTDQKVSEPDLSTQIIGGGGAGT